MRIDGSWLVCDDSIVRPVIRGEVQTEAGIWKTTNSLVDTGADRTVFNAKLLALLKADTTPTSEGLQGVGGPVESVIVETPLQFVKEDGVNVAFRGRFAAFTDEQALDMCVLGRDITNLFAVIVDRPRDVVCLLNQRHSYNIVES